MRSGYSIQLLLVCALAALPLSGCGGAKQAFGMGKVAPDEFTVVTKAPLVVPPDYSLRPPTPGMASLNYTPPGGRAEYALFGRDGDMSDNAQGYTTGEAAFLEVSGGASADPNIRQLINAETASLIEKESSIADSILFWKEPVADATINPTDEKRRLAQTSKAGKKPDESETKSEQPEETGTVSAPPDDSEGIYQTPEEAGTVSEPPDDSKGIYQTPEEADQETQSQEAIDQAAKNELEAQKQREIELEAQKQIEIERAVRKQREIDQAAMRQREIELEAQKRREVEQAIQKQKEIELEAQRQKEIEQAQKTPEEIEQEEQKQKEAELEAQKKKETEEEAERRRNDELIERLF